jgi:hypothetical protein
MYSVVSATVKLITRFPTGTYSEGPPDPVTLKYKKLIKLFNFLRGGLCFLSTCVARGLLGFRIRFVQLAVASHVHRYVLVLIENRFCISTRTGTLQKMYYRKIMSLANVLKDNLTLVLHTCSLPITWRLFLMNMKGLKTLFYPNHQRLSECLLYCAGLWIDMLIYHTMFTWYGHKILFYSVLTVAVSHLHYSTLCLQRQCLV